MEERMEASNPMASLGSRWRGDQEVFSLYQYVEGGDRPGYKVEHDLCQADSRSNSEEAPQLPMMPASPMNRAITCDREIPKPRRIPTSLLL